MPAADPSEDLDVVRFALSQGHAVLGQIGNGDQERAHGLFRLGSASLQLFGLLLELPGLIHHRGYLGRFRAGLAAARHFLAELVTLRLQAFGLGDAGPPLLIELAKVTQQVGRIQAPGTEFLFHQLQVGPHKIQIEHKTQV